MVWKGEAFPDRWKKGNIIPTYKKRDIHNTSNFRRITLLDTAYKIYAMILEKKLTTEAEENNILQDNQSGFRKGRGTTDNIYILNYSIKEEMCKKGEKLYALFTDLKRTFNKINRYKIVETLKKLPTNKHLLARIAENYDETSNSIKTSTGLNEPFWTT